MGVCLFSYFFGYYTPACRVKKVEKQFGKDSEDGECIVDEYVTMPLTIGEFFGFPPQKRTDRFHLFLEIFHYRP